MFLPIYYLYINFNISIFTYSVFIHGLVTSLKPEFNFTEDLIKILVTHMQFNLVQTSLAWEILFPEQS
jgi:hypothetical protein